jgi:hypothetical protein
MMNLSRIAPLSLFLLGGCVAPSETKEVKSDLTYVFGEGEASGQGVIATDPQQSDVKMTDKKSSVVAVELSTQDVAAQINPKDLTPLFEVKVEPQAAPSEKPAPKVYKVIKVGEEEIRVIDKNMGAVEEKALETLRSQKKD